MVVFRCRFSVLFVLTFCLVALLVASPAAARGGCDPEIPAIGWTFDMDIEAEMDLPDCAGLPPFQQTNWNSDPLRGQAEPDPNDLRVLFDSSGSDSGARLIWSLDTTGDRVPNNWRMTSLASTPTPDQKLNHGYQAIDPRIEITDIPYTCYSLVLYYGQDAIDGSSDVTVVGILGADEPITQVQTVRERRLLSRTSSQETRFGVIGDYIEDDGVGEPTPGNVTVFEGLFGEELTVQFVWPGTGNSNTGSSALQIVQEVGTDCLPLFVDGFEAGNLEAWN